MFSPRIWPLFSPTESWEDHPSHPSPERARNSHIPTLGRGRTTPVPSAGKWPQVFFGHVPIHWGHMENSDVIWVFWAQNFWALKTLTGAKRREWMWMGVAGIIINGYCGSFPHSKSNSPQNLPVLRSQSGLVRHDASGRSLSWNWTRV
jgi:hypothetical protein